VKLTVLPILAATLAFTACATDPSTPAPAAKPVVNAVQPASPAPVLGGVPASASAAAGPTTDAQVLELHKFARNQGYKPTTRDGKPIWCKSETPIGSHLAKDVCVPEGALADMQRQSIENQDALGQAQRICSGGACGNK